jgi:2-C-methyl-D-erythritol 2,4-cyclodiphosphate synthase
LQKPKLAAFINDMRKNISSILYCDLDQVSVKATTSEWMGFVGEGKGIKVITTVMLTKE